MKKPKHNVKIEVCNNGCMVTIKRGKEVLGVKVFEDKGENKILWKEWVEETIKNDNLKLEKKK